MVAFASWRPIKKHPPTGVADALENGFSSRLTHLVHAVANLAGVEVSL